MGYWAKYDYVTAILNSPRRLSSIYRRHLCTLIYLPGCGSSSADKVWKAQGRSLCQISGNRLGFLFLRHPRTEDSHPRPSPEKLDRQVREVVFGRDEIETITEPASALAPAELLAQRLNITHKLPCILVITHHFDSGVYLWPLRDGTHMGVYRAFSQFAVQFYEQNDRILRAMTQLEGLFDSHVLSRADLAAALTSMEENGRHLSQILLEGTQATPEAILDKLCGSSDLDHALSSGQCLVDPRLSRVVALLCAGGQLSHLSVHQVTKVVRSLEILLRSLSEGDCVRGTSLNQVVELLAKDDGELLGLLREPLAIVSVDFDAMVSALFTLSAIDLRRRNRLLRHLEKQGWSGVQATTIGLLPEHFGPLSQLARALRSVTDRTALPSLRSLDAALVQIRGSLASARDLYRMELAARLKVFGDEYLGLAKSLRTGIEQRGLLSGHRAYVAMDYEVTAPTLDKLLNSYSNLSQREIRLPQKIRNQLVRLEIPNGLTRLWDLLRSRQSREDEPLDVLRSSLRSWDEPSTAPSVTRDPGREYMPGDAAAAAITVSRPPSVVSSRASPIRMFVSYASADAAFRDALSAHLATLRSLGLISEWHYGEIVPGEEWDAKIRAQLEVADIIVLLLSADFFASEYISRVEIPHALQRHEAGTARVVPVLVRAVEWKRTLLARIQGLPENGKAVKSWTDQDEAWTNVAAGIARVAEALSIDVDASHVPGVPRSKPATAPKGKAPGHRPGDSEADDAPALAPTRRITPEAKAKLNELLASGVKFDEALRQVAQWETFVAPVREAMSAMKRMQSEHRLNAAQREPTIDDFDAALKEDIE